LKNAKRYDTVKPTQVGLFFMALSREQIKRLAKVVYDGIRGRVWCPAFDDFIYFSSRGYKHITHKYDRGERIWRDDADILRRIRLLPSAPGIVADPTVTIIPKPPKNRDKMWRLDKQIGNKMITVMIVQKGNGRKQYLSVADDNLRTA